MKNFLIILFGIGTLTAAYLGLKQIRLPDENRDGELVVIHRGDLTLPINATGKIIFAREVEIKAEASGEVINILKHPGDRTQRGELIVRLDKEEEQRNVDRATDEVNRLEAALAQSKVALEISKGSKVATAKAALAEIEANLPPIKYRRDKIVNDEVSYNPDERLQVVAAYESQLAQRDRAAAAVREAESNIQMQEQQVKQAKSMLDGAKNQLADAQRRLNKTDILSPIDGMIGEMRVQVGEVIQGGKTTITGGSVLCLIYDDSVMKVQAEVDEADLEGVLKIAPLWSRPGKSSADQMPTDLGAAEQAAGTLCEVTVDSFREDVFDGVIERIHPSPRSMSGVTTYPVDIVITSSNRFKLFPGMRAEVEFTAEQVHDVVLCPNEAIREDPTGKFLGVYIPRKAETPGERKTEFVRVKTGLDNGVYTEIREGLAEGTKVYSKLPRVREDDDEDDRKS